MTTFLFSCEIGDPLSCIYLDDLGCMAGSCFGKVWLYNFEERSQETLAEFSEDGVRGLFLDGESAYATIGEPTVGTRVWRRDLRMGISQERREPQAELINLRTIDKRVSSGPRRVLQRGDRVCLLWPTMTSVVNVSTRFHHTCDFKLIEHGSIAEVAPCDFDGDRLLLLDRSHGSSSVALRVVFLEKNELTQIADLPQAHRVTLARLWQEDHFVYVVGGRDLYIYNHVSKAVGRKCIGHRAEVVALDTEHPDVIAALSTDAVVKLWNGKTGACVRTLRMPEAQFSLGFPYWLCVHGKRVLVAADEGAYLTEFEEALR